MQSVGRRAFVATLAGASVLILLIALWYLKYLIGLTLLAFTIAAAMRTGVDALQRRHVPRILGVLLHYIVLAGIVAGVLWFVVPQALDQVEAALGNVPTTSKQLKHAAATSSGFKHEILVQVSNHLKQLPSGSSLIHPAISATKKAFEVGVAIFYVLATSIYWIYERDRFQEVIVSILPERRRRVVRSTWELIDARLGAFVRGELLLILFVGVMLSLAFWLDHEPYWLLLGVFAAVLEIIPVVGPVVAGVAVIAVGLTASWLVAAGAAGALFILRQVEDYLVAPRVLGGAVGLSPFLVLFSVAAIGFLLGPFYVLLAIPISTLLATIVEVTLLHRDPDEQQTPTVLFPAKDTEPQ